MAHHRAAEAMIARCLCGLLLCGLAAAPTFACQTISSCEAAMQRAQGDAAVRRDYGHVLMRSGNHEEALESFRQAIDLAPEDARGYEALGGALAVLRDYAAAVPELERALKLDPGAMQALRVLQFVQEGLRQREAATDTARRLAERGDVIAMYDLALVLAPSEPQQAAYWLRRAAEAGHVAAIDQMALARVDAAGWDH